MTCNKTCEKWSVKILIPQAVSQLAIIPILGSRLVRVGAFSCLSSPFELLSRASYMKAEVTFSKGGFLNE